MQRILLLIILFLGLALTLWFNFVVTSRDMNFHEMAGAEIEGIDRNIKISKVDEGMINVWDQAGQDKEVDDVSDPEADKKTVLHEQPK